MDEVTRAANKAMLERDWEALRLMLHPYVHWTAADGIRLRGRSNVTAQLQAGTRRADLPLAGTFEGARDWSVRVRCPASRASEPDSWPQ